MELQRSQPGTTKNLEDLRTEVARINKILISIDKLKKAKAKEQQEETGEDFTDEERATPWDLIKGCRIITHSSLMSYLILSSLRKNTIILIRTRSHQVGRRGL